ncbi:TetR/AcrR family transcriptional regulator [Agromyces intestinalis]|uniref:TetR/AcrR family transcriptional regulator n=1 Tax=Agromyces intestinalis TaxID=2592652 RepID=A0A5C1YAC9_9MICO|nr:TetR/AcrR family transcriptional regulator [Agromyces intestinalis]QEO13014.1 TetR/AcrR family transcriptional regulator [Agromyces intestinalis]
MPRPLIPDRRGRLLDAAEHIVLERGFDAMSIQSLADEVGIAKGAVYREFASKRHILDALLSRSTDRMSAASKARLDDAEHPSLSRSYAVAAEVLLDDRLMTAAFLDDRGVLGSYLDEKRDDRYRARHRAVVEWIAALQQRGELSTRVDAEALALALSSATIGLLTAAKHLGPLTNDDLRAAIGALAVLVSSLESDAAERPGVKPLPASPPRP